MAVTETPTFTGEAVDACLGRIRQMVAAAIPGATVEVVGEDGPGGRIDLLGRFDGKPIGQSFIMRAECQRAWEDDPGRCRSIDRLGALWVSVLRIKVSDAKSWKRVSSKVRKLGVQAAT